MLRKLDIMRLDHCCFQRITLFTCQLNKIFNVVIQHAYCYDNHGRIGKNIMMMFCFLASLGVVMTFVGHGFRIRYEYAMLTTGPTQWYI